MGVFLNMYILYKCEILRELACMCANSLSKHRDKQAEPDTAAAKRKSASCAAVFAHLQPYRSRYLPSFHCVSWVWRSQAAMWPRSCPSARSCGEIRFDLFLRLCAKFFFYQLTLVESEPADKLHWPDLALHAQQHTHTQKCLTTSMKCSLSSDCLQVLWIKIRQLRSEAANQ